MFLLQISCIASEEIYLFYAMKFNRKSWIMGVLFTRETRHYNYTSEKFAKKISSPNLHFQKCDSWNGKNQNCISR